jgi:manganese/zinc/iron transport system permease protein
MIRRRLLAWGILAEDIVGLLYRIEERGQAGGATLAEVRGILFADRFSLRVVLFWLRRRAQLVVSGGHVLLTEQGRSRARGLVRSHRLWEQYLASQVGVDTARIHHQAEQFEHYTDPGMRGRLDEATDGPRIDPHGTPIPAERETG